ncbi:hypothetical protein [Micromonospora sp. LOL_023]|uniref:hypothetical protein n=1 Tax=Micromonospora sp. LOL_023 TaxID=3345418 RepID=UPI003A85935F
MSPLLPSAAGCPDRRRQNLCRSPGRLSSPGVGGDPYPVVFAVGEQRRHLLPLLGHGGAVGAGESAQPGDGDRARVDADW